MVLHVDAGRGVSSACRPERLREVVAAGRPAHYRSRLDDIGGIATGDPSATLEALASAGAHLRGAAATARESRVASLAPAGLPRTLVVAGSGAAGVAGELLAVIAGPDCPVPVVVHRGYGLPSWVGPADLVVGMSSSGGTAETLTAVEEAGRRGARLVTVGRAHSSMASFCARGGGLHVPLGERGPGSQTCFWSLLVPLLLVAEAVGLGEVRQGDLDDAADVLDVVTERCRPLTATQGNPAKRLALHLAGGIPLVWGAPGVSAVAARRFSCQLTENAKVPSVIGTSSELREHQVSVFDGPLGRGSAGRGGVAPSARIHLVLLRDVDEAPHVARLGAASLILAAECGVPATHVRAEGRHPLARVASLIGTTDFASVYLALALGIDPAPVGAPTTLRPVGLPAQRDRRHW